MAKRLQHLKVAGLVLLLTLASFSLAARPDTKPGGVGGDISTQGFIFNR